MNQFNEDEMPEWINEDKHLEDYMPKHAVHYAKKGGIIVCSLNQNLKEH